MFPGLPTRIETDLSQLYKQNVDKRGKMKISVQAAPKRRHMVFQGALITFDHASLQVALCLLTSLETLKAGGLHGRNGKRVGATL